MAQKMEKEGNEDQNDGINGIGGNEGRIGLIRGRGRGRGLVRPKAKAKGIMEKDIHNGEIDEQLISKPNINIMPQIDLDNDDEQTENELLQRKNEKEETKQRKNRKQGRNRLIIDDSDSDSDILVMGKQDTSSDDDDEFRLDNKNKLGNNIDDDDDEDDLNDLIFNNNKNNKERKRITKEKKDKDEKDDIFSLLNTSKSINNDLKLNKTTTIARGRGRGRGRGISALTGRSITGWGASYFGMQDNDRSSDDDKSNDDKAHQYNIFDLIGRGISDDEEDDDYSDDEDGNIFNRIGKNKKGRNKEMLKDKQKTTGKPILKKDTLNIPNLNTVQSNRHQMTDEEIEAEEEAELQRAIQLSLELSEKVNNDSIINNEDNKRKKRKKKKKGGLFDAPYIFGQDDSNDSESDSNINYEYNRQQDQDDDIINNKNNDRENKQDKQIPNPQVQQNTTPGNIYNRPPQINNNPIVRQSFSIGIQNPLNQNINRLPEIPPPPKVQPQSKPKPKKQVKPKQAVHQITNFFGVNNVNNTVQAPLLNSYNNNNNNNNKIKIKTEYLGQKEEDVGGMTDIELAKIKSGKVTLKHIQKDDKEDFESVFGECPICFVEISVGNMCTKLTICGHSFHTECIKAWLVKKRSCPKCRAIIDISSSATQAPK
ncbi:MAG: hypothetical protein EZS28_002087 [Streblomastix strix]|uniref:RING-type domain-containing protein n=1 Tax=Streblomastix strix TaxID=222440 RepID=A0A5J4X6K4_9EUKA|nr:MAG: hypothetical protein EZS28_002087 [Streblomastix strix]